MGTSTVIHEERVDTPNGSVTLKLHRFKGREGPAFFVQVNRERFRKPTETLWLAADVIGAIQEALAEIASAIRDDTRRDAEGAA